jgi:hypothetical protein
MSKYKADEVETWTAELHDKDCNVITYANDFSLLTEEQFAKFIYRPPLITEEEMNKLNYEVKNMTPRIIKDLFFVGLPEVNEVKD